LLSNVATFTKHLSNVLLKISIDVINRLRNKIWERSIVLQKIDLSYRDFQDFYTSQGELMQIVKLSCFSFFSLKHLSF